MYTYVKQSVIQYLQIDWPEIGTDGLRQTKVIYKFQYLPTGLFNRVQVIVWLIM
jgi:hypothetical protein